MESLLDTGSVLELDNNKHIIKATDEEIAFVELLIENDIGKKWCTTRNNEHIFHIASKYGKSLKEAHILYHAVLNKEISSEARENVLKPQKHFDWFTLKGRRRNT